MIGWITALSAANNSDSIVPYTICLYMPCQRECVFCQLRHQSADSWLMVFVCCFEACCLPIVRLFGAEERVLFEFEVLQP